MTRRTLTVLAGAALCLAAVAACTGGGGTPGTTTTTSQGGQAGSSTAPAPTSKSGQGPAIANPIKTDAIKDKPCDLLKPAQLTSYGITKPGKTDTIAIGPSCRWSPDNPRKDTSVSATFNTNGGGLAGAIAGKGNFAYFKEIGQLAGYPAVDFNGESTVDHGVCFTEVGVNDTVTIQVDVTVGDEKSPSYKTPCKVSNTIAEQVIGNLKGGS